MKSLLITTLILLVIVKCTSNNSTIPTDQSQLLDLFNVPQHIRELDSLTVLSPDIKPLSSIQFEVEQQFGKIYPGIPSPTVGFGPEMAVDQKGNVYRADKSRKTINVYSSGGKMLTQIGREGKGPGEFMEISSITIYDQRLIVYDSKLIRIHIFTLNPVKLSKTVIINTQSWEKFDEVRISRPSTIFGLKKSTILAAVILNERNARSYYGYYILNLEGNIISDMLVEQQRLLNYQITLGNGRKSYTRLPFTTKGIVDVARNGTIYHVNTSNFLIQIYDSAGNLQRAIFYPYDKDPLEKEEALEQFHPNLHRSIRNAELPDTWPALESMFVDDKNRIWVATITDDNNSYDWWILEDSGELRSKFTWPRDEPIQVVREGKMYVSIEDEESGARKVVRYHIAMD